MNIQLINHQGNRYSYSMTADAATGAGIARIGFSK